MFVFLQKAIDGIEGALFADSDNLIMTVQRAYEVSRRLTCVEMAFDCFLLSLLLHSSN